MREAKRTFKVPFNGRTQYFEVYVYDVHPKTFVRWADTNWAFYWVSRERNDKEGYFGELHLIESRTTIDTVAHELQHLWIDWCKSRNIEIANSKKEEDICFLSDELTRNFWRKWGRVYRRKTVPIP